MLELFLIVVVGVITAIILVYTGLWISDRVSYYFWRKSWEQSARVGRAAVQKWKKEHEGELVLEELDEDFRHREDLLEDIISGAEMALEARTFAEAFRKKLLQMDESYGNSRNTYDGAREAHM